MTGLTFEVMMRGGEGVISVVSNVVPAMVSALCRSCANGDFTEALAIDRQLASIVAAAFVEVQSHSRKGDASLHGANGKSAPSSPAATRPGA